MGRKPKKYKVKATTKARGDCPKGCVGRIFNGYGNDEDEAKEEAERKCIAAGCHTPGGDPHNCNCGHTTVYWLP